MSQRIHPSSRPRRASAAGAAILPLLLALVAALPAPAQDAPVVIRGAEVSEPITPFVFEGDLRRLPLAPAWRPGDPVKEIPRRHTRPIPPPELVFGTPEPTEDPLLERQRAFAGDPAEAFELPFLDIAGQGYSGVNPPDTVGEVGPTDYIQMINAGGGTSVAVYDKLTGEIAAGPFILDNLGSGNCATGLGDPIVLYDELADRWLLSEFSLFGNRLCVYVSRTSDPITGGWYNYAFQASSFPDYPKYAVWPDAYYVTTNEGNPAVYALDRERMLDGLSATFQRTTAPPLSGFGFQALTPADLDGATAPPAGEPHYLIRHKDDEVHSGGTDPNRDFLELFAWTIDWDDPSNSAFVGPFPIAIAEIDSNMCGLFSFSCFDQPGGADLDPLREVVMWRSQYRNFGTHQTLVGNLVTDVGVDLGAVRWYELRDSGDGWFLYQEGTWSPDGDNRWMGSAAMDAEGNLAVGYNVSSTSTFPALRYAGRRADDPLGVMTSGEISMVEGAGSNSSNRYGDYSSLNVDPVDGCTYWFTGEYNRSSNWSTRIGAFAFDGCERVGPEFVIDSLEPCEAGADNDWNVVGATPGATVTVVCNPIGSGSQLTVGSAVADANGDATIGRFVPPGAGGRTIECVAEDSVSGGVTPQVTKSFP